jgi:hypothetical protein
MRLLLPLFCLTLACRDAGAPSDAQDLLPPQLRLVAEAHSVDENGLRIDCSVETVVTLAERVDRDQGRLVQYGSGGGDASRFRDISAERSVQFWADTHFPTLEFHLIGTDSIEIRSPESEGVTERFWREFAVWAGQRTAAGGSALAGGPWTCQPMDTPPSSGEYYDAEGVAAGSWTLLVTQ